MTMPLHFFAMLGLKNKYCGCLTPVDRLGGDIKTIRLREQRAKYPNRVWS